VAAEAVCLVSFPCPFIMLGRSAGPDGVKGAKEDGEQGKAGEDK